MNANSIKSSRGRPKTLNREHILDVAVQAYWKDGAGEVSINEVCRQAKVSKPGVYREFGNEDGLRTAALLAYQQKVLTPTLQILSTGESFREALNKLVSFITLAGVDQGSPRGCLLVKMRGSRMRMGEETQAQIDRAQRQVLTVYEAFVERSKAKGEFTADMSPQFAASYIDSQITNALTQMAWGEPRNTVRKILTMAFSVLD